MGEGTQTKQTEAPLPFIQLAEVCWGARHCPKCSGYTHRSRQQTVLCTMYRGTHWVRVENALSGHDVCSEGKARGVVFLDGVTLETWDYLGKYPWKKTQQVPGSWDGTCWEEIPSSIHSLCRVLMLLLQSRFSRVQLCVTPSTVAHQAPLSLGFSRQEHWSGLPFPSPMYESEKWKWSRLVVSDS